MNVAEILNAAADLIEPEGAWCQRAAARNTASEPVAVRSAEARSWCMLGAIDWVVFNQTGWMEALPIRVAVWDALRDEAGARYMAPWNDVQGRTRAEVVTMLRRVAEHINR